MTQTWEVGPVQNHGQPLRGGQRVCSGLRATPGPGSSDSARVQARDWPRTEHLSRTLQEQLWHLNTTGTGRRQEGLPSTCDKDDLATQDNVLILKAAH